MGRGWVGERGGERGREEVGDERLPRDKIR